MEARTELMLMEEYDYVVINDVVETAAGKLKTIIKAERLKVSRNKEFIDSINQEEL
jgi:guanylate kinase